MSTPDINIIANTQSTLLDISEEGTHHHDDVTPPYLLAAQTAPPVTTSQSRRCSFRRSVSENFTGMTRIQLLRKKKSALNIHAQHVVSQSQAKELSSAGGEKRILGHNVAHDKLGLIPEPYSASNLSRMTDICLVSTLTLYSLVYFLDFAS
jgi:hypothetical protein